MKHLLAVTFAAVLLTSAPTFAHDNRSDIFAQKAQRLFKERKYDEAIKAAESAIRLGKRGDAYYVIIKCHLMRNDDDKAAKALQAILADRLMPHSPKRDYIHYLMGTVYRRKDDAEKARQHFAAAVKLAPNSARNRIALKSVSEKSEAGD